MQPVIHKTTNVHVADDGSMQAAIEVAHNIRKLIRVILLSASLQ